MGIQYGSRDSIERFPDGFGAILGLVVLGEGVGIGVTAGWGVGLRDGEGLGSTEALGLGDADGDGDGLINETPLFQTNFFPDLIQVNFLFL